EHDADVAEAEEKPQPYQPPRCFRRVFEQAGVVDQQTDHAAEQQSETGRREGAERDSLEHLVYGNQQTTEAEAGHETPSSVADVLRPHLADGETTRGA